MSDIRTRPRWMASALTGLVAALAFGAFASTEVASSSQRPSTVKALVGGTLIDGFDGRPIRK